MAFLLSFFHPAVRNLGVMAGALAAVLGHKGEGHGVGRLKGAWNTVNFAGTTQPWNTRSVFYAKE